MTQIRPIYADLNLDMCPLKRKLMVTDFLYDWKLRLETIF